MKLQVPVNQQATLGHQKLRNRLQLWHSVNRFAVYVIRRFERYVTRVEAT